MSEVTLTREQIKEIASHGAVYCSHKKLKDLCTLALRGLDVDKTLDRILKQVEVSQSSEAEKPEAVYVPTVAWLGFMHIKDAITEYRNLTKGPVT